MMSKQAENKSENALDEILARINQTFRTEFEPLEVDGRVLEVLEIRDMPRHLDKLLSNGSIKEPLRDLPLWSKIWPASFVLGGLLRKFDPVGKNLLELGCGTAVCSLIAAQHGFSSILATDMQNDALDFARANVLKNGLEDKIAVRWLDIRAPGKAKLQEGGFDLIAASEILYLEDLFRPLLKFLDRQLKAQGKALFCTDLGRVKPRFAKLAAKDFRIQEGKIAVKSLDEEGNSQGRIYSVLILEKP